MNLCVKCAQYERTCCQKTEVFITDGDIQRISEHVGDRAFWHYRQPADTDLVQPQPQDPNWLLYTVRPDGTRPQLHQQPSGDCTFLTPTGCALPTGVRPLICRLYPYDYTETGISGIVPGCPTYLLQPGQTLLEGIGMRLDEAKRWQRQLYDELRIGSIWHENRHYLRPAS